MAPAKTPKEIINKLYVNLKEITEDKELQSHMLANGVALQAKSLADFGAFIKSEKGQRAGTSKLLNTTGNSINN